MPSRFMLSGRWVPAPDVLVPSGHGSVGLVGSGAREGGGGSTSTKTGFATLIGVASGANQTITQETGHGTLGTLGTGTKALVGALLLEDGSSEILLEDASGSLLLEG